MSSSNFYVSIDNPENIDLNKVFDTPFERYNKGTLRTYFDEVGPDVSELNFVVGQDIRWYESEQDFIDLSKKYPSIVWEVEERDTDDPDDVGRIVVTGGVSKRNYQDLYWRNEVEDCGNIYTLHYRDKDYMDTAAFLSVSNLVEFIGKQIEDLNERLDEKIVMPEMKTIEEVVSWITETESTLSPYLDLYAKRCSLI